MGQDPAGGPAGLASRPPQIHTLDRALYGSVQIGVGTNNQRILATKFQLRAFHAVSCTLQHRLAGWHTAHKADSRNTGMGAD